MNKVLKHLNLKGFETKVFPSKLCTKPSLRPEEMGVMESTKYFVCVIVDKRFEQGLRISLLRPYTWTDDPEDAVLLGHRADKLYFGWVDKYGNITDHKNWNKTGSDHVVAWKPA